MSPHTSHVASKGCTMFADIVISVFWEMRIYIEIFLERFIGFQAVFFVMLISEFYLILLSATLLNDVT